MLQSRQVTINHQQSGIQVEIKTEVNINPTMLFSRLNAIVQRKEDMASFFK